MKAFVDDTAAETGKGRSTIAREVKRGADIRDVAQLAGTSLDSGAELDAMARLPEAEQRKLATAARRPAGSQRVPKVLDLVFLRVVTHFGSPPSATGSSAVTSIVFWSVMNFGIIARSMTSGSIPLARRASHISA